MHATRMVHNSCSSVSCQWPVSSCKNFEYCWLAHRVLYQVHASVCTGSEVQWQLLRTSTMVVQFAKIKEQLYAVAYTPLFAADWKAALGAFSLQSSGYYPCVKCEAVAHKQVANKDCPQCKRWPCWHNQLLALHPAILEAATVRHASQGDVQPDMAVGGRRIVRFEGVTGRDSGSEHGSEAPDREASVASMPAAAADRPNILLPPIPDDQQLLNCTVRCKTRRHTQRQRCPGHPHSPECNAGCDALSYGVALRQACQDDDRLLLLSCRCQDCVRQSHSSLLSGQTRP